MGTDAVPANLALSRRSTTLSTCPGITPLDDTVPQQLFRAAADVYKSNSLAIASRWPLAVEQWVRVPSTSLPRRATTCRRHCTTPSAVIACESDRMTTQDANQHAAS